MTNVRVMTSFKCTKDKDGHRHFEYVIDDKLEDAYGLTDADKTKMRKKRDPITDEEIQKSLANIDALTSEWSKNYPTWKEYFKLRAKAVVSTAKIFGKRRSEIASLEMMNIKISEQYLKLTFVLQKKRKMGLFQYQKYLEKRISKGEIPYSELASKTQQQLIDEWKLWRETDAGHKTKVVEAEKIAPLSNPFVQMIIEYYSYIKRNHPTTKYLFPLGKALFNEYKIFENRHIDGDRLFRIVKEINPDLWMHLFRELVGGEVAIASQAKGDSPMESVYKVKRALNLEREETAWHYTSRAFPEKMGTE